MVPAALVAAARDQFTFLSAESAAPPEPGLPDYESRFAALEESLRQIQKGLAGLQPSAQQEKRKPALRKSKPSEFPEGVDPAVAQQALQAGVSPAALRNGPARSTGEDSAGRGLQRCRRGGGDGRSGHRSWWRLWIGRSNDSGSVAADKVGHRDGEEEVTKRDKELEANPGLFQKLLVLIGEFLPKTGHRKSLLGHLQVASSLELPKGSRSRHSCHENADSPLLPAGAAEILKNFPAQEFFAPEGIRASGSVDWQRCGFLDLYSGQAEVARQISTQFNIWVLAYF